jgi:urease accessory protein
MRSTEIRLPRGFRAYDRERLEQRPPGSVGKDARLEATLERDTNGMTRLTHDYVRAPFHLMGSVHHDDHLDDLVALYIQNPAGGVAQGDRYRIDIRAKSGARAHVTTQSAMKIHRMERNYARSCIDITADEGAYLEFLPDHVIMYRDARFQQSVDVELEPNATVVLSETLVSGRLARDEAFEYDRYHSRLQARRDGRPVCTDTVALAPEEGGYDRQGILDDYDVVGSLYVLSTAVDTRTLSDRIHDRLASDEGTRASASTLPDSEGVVVRILGDSAESVTNAVRRAWDETRTAVLGVGAHRRRKY